MNARKVTYARLHQRIHFGEVGDLGDVFDTSRAVGKTLESLSLTTINGNLSVSFLYKGSKKELLIPSANVVFMSLSPEEDKTPLKAVKSA